MTILDELLNSLQKSDVDEQLKIVCDQIAKEEIIDPSEYEGPFGANIFLSLPVEVKVDKRYENYICLEREAQNKYIVSHWCCLKNDISKPKRVKAWDIKQDEPKKILKEFAERMSYLKGE